MADTPQLKFNVKNNSGITDDKVFLGFWGSLLNATLNDKPMEMYTWYTLSEITSIVMDVTTSGRFYVAYNEAFTADGAAIPPILVPGAGAYSNRFDKFELTFDGTVYGVADLTAIDYWSIPMSLTTSKGGVATGDSLNGFKTGSNGKDLYDALSALSTPPQSTAAGESIIADFAAAKNPLAQGIKDYIEKPATGVVTDASGNFIRIIGPNSYPPFGEPAENQAPGNPFTPYNTFMEYFQHLVDRFGPGKTSEKFTRIGDGKIAHLKGEYGGTKGQTEPIYLEQSFDFWASIDSDSNLTITGSGSVVGTIELKVPKWDLLNPASTYGGNPLFYLNGVKQTVLPNNLCARLFGDFFAGLNIGAVGSSVSVDGTLAGDMNSTEWFATLPQAGMMFDKLWTGGETNYWNQWAKALISRSDAYNFAYAERFSAPQISIAPVNADEITLELLDASITV